MMGTRFDPDNKFERFIEYEQPAATESSTTDVPTFKQVIPMILIVVIVGGLGILLFKKKS